jgi:hypothetical protein
MLGVDSRLPELSLQIGNAIRPTDVATCLLRQRWIATNSDRGSLADRIAGGTELSSPLVDDVAVHADDRNCQRSPPMSGLFSLGHGSAGHRQPNTAKLTDGDNRI